MATSRGLKSWWTDQSRRDQIIVALVFVLIPPVVGFVWTRVASIGDGAQGTETSLATSTTAGSTSSSEPVEPAGAEKLNLGDAIDAAGLHITFVSLECGFQPVFDEEVSEECRLRLSLRNDSNSRQAISSLATWIVYVGPNYFYGTDDFKYPFPGQQVDSYIGFDVPKGSAPSRITVEGLGGFDDERAFEIQL